MGLGEDSRHRLKYLSYCSIASHAIGSLGSVIPLSGLRRLSILRLADLPQVLTPSLAER